MVGVPTIDSYQFGRIEIDGKFYRHDVIITPDRVISDWWREHGHSLTLNDISAAIAEKPALLIVGKGWYARMEIPEEIRLGLQALDIELLARPTGEACEQYNSLAAHRHVVAALHLSC
jgi:hypothetical protein